MIEVPTSKGAVRVPETLLTRVSARLARLAPEHRAHSVGRATARLNGKYPRLSDAARVAAGA